MATRSRQMVTVFSCTQEPAMEVLFTKMSTTEVFEAINYAKAGGAARIDSKDRYIAIHSKESMLQCGMDFITFDELRYLKNKQNTTDLGPSIT